MNKDSEIFGSGMKSIGKKTKMGSMLKGFNWILSKIRYVPCDVLAEPMWLFFSGMIKLRSLPILSQKSCKIWPPDGARPLFTFFVYIFAFACLDNFADEANAFSLCRAHKKCFFNMNSKFRIRRGWLSRSNLPKSANLKKRKKWILLILL